MSALSAVLRKQPGRVAWWCPGCEEAHAVPVEGPGAWTWDGNVDTPTFTPSVAVTGTSLTPAAEAMIARGERPASGTYPHAVTRCHSNVTGGNIQFHADCTHALAGHLVSIPPWPENYSDGDSGG